MSDEKIFGLTKEQIRKQAGLRDYAVDPESKAKPIREEDGFLEPCIRGSQKIMDDPEKVEMFRRIYRGKTK